MNFKICFQRRDTPSSNTFYARFRKCIAQNYLETLDNQTFIEGRSISYFSIYFLESRSLFRSKYEILSISIKRILQYKFSRRLQPKKVKKQFWWGKHIDLAKQMHYQRLLRCQTNISALHIKQEVRWHTKGSTPAYFNPFRYCLFHAFLTLHDLVQLDRNSVISFQKQRLHGRQVSKEIVQSSSPRFIQAIHHLSTLLLAFPHIKARSSAKSISRSNLAVI